VERGRHLNRLRGGVPQSQNGAENDGEINRALDDAAVLFFGADEQCVGRFESFGGVSFGFHGVGLVDDRLICKARANDDTRVLNS